MSIPDINLFVNVPYGETFKGVYPFGSDSMNYSREKTYSRTRTSASTPDFLSKRRMRLKTRPATLPFNFYYDRKVTTDIAQHSLYFIEKSTSRKGLEFGCFAMPMSTVPDISELDPLFLDLRNSCISKMPSTMNGNSFNLPLFLVEARKSVDMIEKAVSLIYNKLKALKPSQIHNYWLEYRYGWRLLLKDIYDSLVAIHDARTRSIVQHARTKSTKKSVTEYTSPVGTASTLGGYYTPQFGFKRKIEDTFECNLVLNYHDTPVVGTLQSFGITNPLSVAWELIPYSFVLDWFVPVGNYLSSLDGYIGKTFHSGMWSYIRNTTDTITPINPTWGSPYNLYFSVQALIAPPTVRTTRIYRRDPLWVFPSISLPTIDVRLNTQRILDGISLALQLVPTLNAVWGKRHP